MIGLVFINLLSVHILTYVPNELKNNSFAFSICLIYIVQSIIVRGNDIAFVPILFLALTLWLQTSHEDIVDRKKLRVTKSTLNIVIVIAAFTSMSWIITEQQTHFIKTNIREKRALSITGVVVSVLASLMTITFVIKHAKELEVLQAGYSMLSKTRNNQIMMD